MSNKRKARKYYYHIRDSTYIHEIFSKSTEIGFYVLSILGTDFVFSKTRLMFYDMFEQKMRQQFFF